MLVPVRKLAVNKLAPLVKKMDQEGNTDGVAVQELFKNGVNDNSLSKVYLHNQQLFVVDGT